MKSTGDLEKELYATQNLKNQLTELLSREVPSGFEEYPYFYIIHRMLKEKLSPEDFSMLENCFHLHGLENIEEILKFTLEVPPYSTFHPVEEIKERVQNNFPEIPYNIRYKAETYFGIYSHDVRRTYVRLGYAYRNSKPLEIEQLTKDLRKYISF